MMGSLDVGSYADIIVALVPMTLAFAAIATLPRVLDLVSLGRRRGRIARRGRRRAPNGSRSSARRCRPARRYRWAGRFRFVGIIVPHIVRLIVGADHRLVLPAAALFGASFLVVCDLVARTAFGPVELPVGARDGAARRTVLPMAAVPQMIR